MEKFIYKKSAGVTVLSASLKDFAYKKHCHKEYALGVTLRGIQQYNLDGSLQSSYQSGIMLFNPEQSHDGRSQDKTGIDYVMVYIDPNMFLDILEKKEIVYFSSPIVYDCRLEQSILNLSNAILNEKDEALCSELLLSLADNLSKADISTVYRKDDATIKKAKEMIYYNLESTLRLDDICKELNMSKFKFIRLFKASTGIPPYQYFLNCKVEFAKQSIEKNKDIYSAISEYGFVDLTHLNKHFKRIYGVTAFEYMSHLK
ncbi:AraC family transcriptional regulator [Gottschalkia acidurici 9a]|uniref:AraC family transcriptional regulator n=1 Tax=Gottschalkia acidurici (strain ATCC 7906 / DSM 604 / BCRC 14475 / CIP 104303 / KCTC 5404 / NCIMB 10678 / 9a) TaxID=1128398 RepID=K0AWJ2_GOTA9|nr:AraC family transcriptional regulator [Gottschalkia acidurici]AFS77604.1 AraC family transcriptional regulator [Gottschalkia acidurici 9a]